MSFLNKTACQAAFPAMLGVVLISGCPFQEEPFEPGPAGAGGGTTSTGSGAATGEGGSSGNPGSGGNGSGGGGGKSECVVPDKLLDGQMPYMEVLKSDTDEHIHCYVLFTDLANWDDANQKCKDVMPWSRLAVIHNKAEHDKVLEWLKAISGQYTGPWIGGRRKDDNSIMGSNSPGAFEWRDQGGEAWSIYPCDTTMVSPCDAEKNHFWGSLSGNEQPNGYGDCVQYGIWPEKFIINGKLENTAREWTEQGLGDTHCDNQRGYLCEWQMDPP